MFVYNVFIKAKQCSFLGGIIMRIKNFKRFITSIIVFIGILVSMCLFISNVSFSHSEGIKTKTIYASFGDTLWSIAKTEQKENKYYENKNIMEIIADIKLINNLETSNIYNSQKLLIPYI